VLTALPEVRFSAGGSAFPLGNAIRKLFAEKCGKNY
jgi:hypothetical protein